MKKDKEKSNRMAELRRRAEERLQRLGETPVEELSSEEARSLIHELQTHQIELEMQNEDLRAAQIGLEDSRSRYSDLYDFSPLGYFTLGLSGMIVEANLTGTGLLGETRSYLINKRLTQFIPREHQDAFYLHRRETLDTKTLQRCEIKLRKKDGTEFFAQLESIALEDQEGNVTQLRMSVSDITQRKESEKALREQEHLNERIADAAPYILYIYDLIERRAVWVNSQISTVLGYAPETVQEMGSGVIERLVHQDDKPLLEQHHQELMSDPTDKPREVEYRAMHKNHQWRLLRTRDVIFSRDPEGTPREILGTAVDITEFRKTGNALRDSEERFRSVVESAHEGIISIDRAGNIISWNRGAQQIFGYAADEMLGQPVTVIVPEQFHAKHQHGSGNAVAKEPRVLGETRYLQGLRKDGRVFPLELSLATWRKEEETYFTGIVRDISIRKQTEEALQLSHLFLEIANRHVELPSLLREFVAKIQRFTGCSAVGIGVLDERGDLSCRDYVGFTRDFCEKEGPLLMRQYRTTCAQRTRGKTDPDPPAWTEGGSFFTTSTTEFLGTDALRELHPMGNVCNLAGYESVGLIPIRDGRSLRGLIHVADPLKDRLTPEKVKILEKVAMQLGTTIHRVMIEEELNKHREHLEEIVEQRTVELQKTIEQLAHEIRERKQAEQQIKQMALFAALNPSPVFRFDETGRVAMVNPATVEIFGEGATAGVPVTTLIPGIESFDLMACIQNGAILSHATQIGDRFFHFVFKGVPNLRFGQIYGTDITQRKLAEAEAIRANHLASLGEMAAGVAHEINNPTNGIINYAQLLSNRCQGDDPVHDLADRIMQEGHRIARIVKSLLSFARDRQEEKSVLHVHEVLSNALALTESALRKNKIRIKVGFPADLPPILANSQEIQQVFLNIINNARYALNRKYPEGDDEKILEIDAERVRVKGHHCLRIVFHDRGIGIPARILDKVLNPFFTTKPEDQGTGLGLSISHGIVSKHNGKIMFESKEGEYTKVMVDFPLAPDAVDPA
jgi:PAS domain S-box-containing protein